MTPAAGGEGEAPSSWRNPFARIRRFLSRHKNRKSEYVFFVTNYDSHADSAIREFLLHRSSATAASVPDETALPSEQGPGAGTQSSPGHAYGQALSRSGPAASPRAGGGTGEASAAGSVSSSPHPHSFPDSRASFLRGVRPDNEIHTAKYSFMTFLPLVLFYQLTRFSNFYFLCVAMLQLVPPISDSGGVPTYLIPISIIVGLAIVKEFFEDFSRHRSDEEENSKEVLLFENGKLVSKQWRDVRVGDVVKITAGQQFPADLVLLNCAHDFGICNVETKNVDGESNVKSRFCLPQLTGIFADDEAAGKAKVRFVCEPACDNLTSFSGKVILPALTERARETGGRVERRTARRDRGRRTRPSRRRRVRPGDSQRVGDPKGGEESKAGGPVREARDGQESEGTASGEKRGTAGPPSGRHVGFSPGASDRGRSSTGDDAVIEEDWSGEDTPGGETDGEELHHEDFGGAEIVDREAVEEGRPAEWLANGRREEIGGKRRWVNDAETKEHEEEIALSFKQLLLRGTSMVETKWAYGAVVYSGKQTRLMMNGRVGSLQKWSRLELNYSSHVVVMIFVQVLSVLLLSFMSIYWIETQGYQAAYLDLRHYISTLQNFGITFGATFLVFASFVPIDIFMLWEICRFVQGLFINFDDQMYCAETQKHARSQAAQLIEEMGNVTHVYSDKTGTLTKNLMQLKCVGLGEGFEYGMDRWCDERASMNVTDKKFQKQMHLLKTEASRRSALSRRLSARPSPSPSFLSAPWPDSSTGGPNKLEPFASTPHVTRDSGTSALGQARRPASHNVPLSQQLAAGTRASPAASGESFYFRWKPRGSACDASDSRRSQAPTTKVNEPCVPSALPTAHADAAFEKGNAGTNPPTGTGRSRRKMLRGEGSDTGGAPELHSREASGPLFLPSDLSDGVSCSQGASTVEPAVMAKGRHDLPASQRVPEGSPGASNQPLETAVLTPLFLRGNNSFVSLDRLELACSLLRAPADVLDRARHLFLVMGLCHTVLVREKKMERENSDNRGQAPQSLMERLVGQPLLSTVLPRRNSLGTEERSRSSRRRMTARGGLDQLGTASSGEGRSRQGSLRRRVSGCGAAAVAALSSCASGEHVRSRSLGSLRRSRTVSLAECKQRAMDSQLDYSLENGGGSRRVEWVDEASGFAFREFSLEAPQYDASSPDELCLISACNFFGLEFAARPSLMDIELEFTSTFMIELLLRWKQEAEMRVNKRVADRWKINTSQGDAGVGGDRSPSGVPGFTDMTEQLLLKQLERAQKIISGQQSHGPASSTQLHPEGFEAIREKEQQQSQECQSVRSVVGAPRAQPRLGESNGVAEEGRDNGHEDKLGQGGKAGDGTDREGSVGGVLCSRPAVPFLSFEILDVLEFDNTRKRMSVITRGFDGRYLLLCKGADTQMIEVAASGQDQHLAFIDAQLQGFASSGLRTLVFGYRYLPTDLYEDFHTQFTSAQQLLGEEQEKAVAECMAMVEKELVIVGCSGIEDKLQDDVQGTIRDLKAAGMKVWVLTGDKLETAINIGHSTNLISEDAYNAVIDANNKDAIAEQLTRYEKHCMVADLLGHRGTDSHDSQWWDEIDWGDLGMDPEEEELKELLRGQASRRETKSFRSKSFRGDSLRQRSPNCTTSEADARPVDGGSAYITIPQFREGEGGREDGGGDMDDAKNRRDEHANLLQMEAQHGSGRTANWSDQWGTESAGSRSVAAGSRSVPPDRDRSSLLSHTVTSQELLQELQEAYEHRRQQLTHTGLLPPVPRLVQSVDEGYRRASRIVDEAATAVSIASSPVYPTTPLAASPQHASLSPQPGLSPRLSDRVPCEPAKDKAREESNDETPVTGPGPCRYEAASVAKQPGGLLEGGAVRRAGQYRSAAKANNERQQTGDGCASSSSPYIRTPHSAKPPLSEVKQAAQGFTANMGDPFCKESSPWSEQGDYGRFSDTRVGASSSFPPLGPGSPGAAPSISGANVRFREYSEFCMTVTGSALGVIMQERLLKVKFYSLARHASTLIASRVTPKQKALLLKQNTAFNPRGTSLAIGDGANDVAMILAASVGVGIAGKEGLQAARSADFSIGEFRFLRNLLFVHGREALRRNCILIYVCIFRNAIMCWCTLAMNFLSGFSGLDVWNPWTKQVVSIAFTCLPVLGFVTMDRQVPQRVLLENPVLYEIIPSTFWPYYTSRRALEARQWVDYLILEPAARSCRALWRILLLPFACLSDRVDLSFLYTWFQHRKKPENDRCYGTHCLLLWLAFALWVAACQLTFTIYSVVGAWTPKINLSHGFTSLQFDSFSHIMELAYVIIVNGVVALLTNTWSVVEICIHAGELVAALLFWVVISYWKLFLNIVGAEVLHGTFILSSLCAAYYFGLVLTIITCLLPLLLPMAWQLVRKPTLEQILVEQLAQGSYKPTAARRGRREGVAYVAVESPEARGESAGAAAAGDEYKGFAFTHEPVFGVLPALQEAFKAMKKTGEGAKVLLRKTQTFIKGEENGGEGRK